MEKNTRKIGTIVIIILTLLILVLLFFAFRFYNNYLNKNDAYKELYDKYDQLVLNNNELLDTQKNISNEIDSIFNIDINISNVKKKVFELASQLEQKIKNGESDVKIAYLTFDDGPYYMTYDYLNVLDRYGVKATFFTIGFQKTSCYDKSSYDCTKLYKEIVDRGHTIANHTYSHAIFFGLYNSVDSFMKQVIKHEDYIKEKTGVITNIVRFPGGAASAGRLKEGIKAALKEKNYGWVDWTAIDGDGGDLYSTSEAWEKFTKSIDEDIEVVLMHDYSSITLSILPKAIEYLQENNYILLPLFYESVMINK